MNKTELLLAMAEDYVKLNEQIGKMVVTELEASFQFANNPKNAVLIGFMTNAPVTS